MKKKYKIGGLLAGQTLTIDENLLKYQCAYGKRFSVPLQQISTVSVGTAKGLGKASLVIIGNGTELAKVDLPASWASHAQEWLLSNLTFSAPANTVAPVSSVDEIGKLSELKEKGAITQAEFDAKKKQLLDL